MKETIVKVNKTKIIPRGHHHPDTKGRKRQHTQKKEVIGQYH